MHILVTNDDGYMAPGIQALVKSLAELGNIVLAAPLEEQSASGHGITLRQPIQVRELSIPGTDKAWAVAGTPADCVKLAVKEFMSEPFGLLVSGINNGPNLGTDVLYSGTVSAAIEGALLGIPSMAVSLASYEYSFYATAAHITKQLIQQMYHKQRFLPPDTLLNMNVPGVAKAKIKGFRVTKLGVREYADEFEKRTDPRGNSYYWMKGSIVPPQEKDPDVDAVAVEKNYVSITPLQFDLTNYNLVKQVEKWGLEDIRL